jgi:hypothetical protein
MATTVYKIFPSIGIARLGNCPSSLPADYYYGPETPGSVVVPSNGYKDPQGRVRRQAARFRIYRFDDGVLVGEVTASPQQNISITWTVELANTKAAYNQFLGIGHAGGLRNASVTDRNSLMIKPGPRSIGPSNFATFNSGAFLGVPVPLGEIQTDAAGRLTVLGGFGSSGSPGNVALTTFANNDGWHDDVSDGPVNATVTIGTTDYPVVGAWVICPPPRFAPPVPHSITLYDSLLQTAVNRGMYTPPSKPSFTNDIYPILRAQYLLQWVTPQLPSSYYTALQAAMNQNATAAQRNAVFQQLRPPSTPPTTSTPHLMPAFWSDYFADIKKGNWVSEPLTVTQYNMLAAWAAGNFIMDWPGTPPSSITPDGLTRAALENCNGGPFFPGIETSYMTRDSYPYREPFRLDGSQLSAGDLTKQNAVPWQADFYDCDYQNPLSWWPVSRPEDVYVAGSSKPIPWERGIKSTTDMVNLWSSLGFLVQSGNSILLSS